jgi:hypothetical protein
MFGLRNHEPHVYPYNLLIDPASPSAPFRSPVSSVIPSAHGPAGRPLQQFPVGPYLECQRAKYILYSVYNKSYRKKIKISIFTILSTDYFDRHGGFGTCSKGSHVGASAGTGGASQLRSR